MLNPSVISILQKLKHSFYSKDFSATKRKAELENPWFTSEMIDYSVSSIYDNFLDCTKLEFWLSQYPITLPNSHNKVGIIAAGNIPMVSFHDILCSIVTNQKIYLKPSSKDIVLIEFIVNNLDYNIELVDSLDANKIDKLIATGNSHTIDKISSQSNFSTLSTLLRGTRHSVAVLSSQESTAQLNYLSDDIFLYHGMGCRSITHLFLPSGYDIEILISHLTPFSSTYYTQKVHYERSRMLISNEPFIDAETFLLKELSPNTSPPIGVVGYSYYTIPPILDMTKIQCTVGLEHLNCNVNFGDTQTPSLNNYANQIDTIKFLLNSF